MALPEAVQKQAEMAEAIENSISAQGGGQASEQLDPEEYKRLTARYASLQGKYNAEVPRLHEKLHELEEFNNYLAQKLEAAEQSAKEVPQEALITEQDTEMYGQDMVELIKRGARQETQRVEQLTGGLLAEVESLKSQLNDVYAKEAAYRDEQFYSALTMKCPHWEQQNENEGFLAWLSEADPYLGIVRHEALNRAFEARDPDRVASIFLAYSNAKRGNRELARQVTPRSSAASGNWEATANAGRMWSQEEIQSFYEQWRRGHIPDDQAEEIEKQINQAVASGRVV